METTQQKTDQEFHSARFALCKSRPTKREPRLLTRKGWLTARCIRMLPLRRQVVQVRDCIGSAGGKRLGRPPTLKGCPIGGAQSQLACTRQSRLCCTAFRRVQRIHMHMHVHTRISPDAANAAGALAVRAEPQFAPSSDATRLFENRACARVRRSCAGNQFRGAIGMEIFHGNRNQVACECDKQDA